MMQQLDESLGSKGMNRMKGECRVVHHSDRAIDQSEQDVASYEEIEEPKILIESPSESRILVNGGPGVGKTFTVIERLAFLAETEIVDLNSVVVLCFSRSAVAVIRDRLKEKISEGSLPSTTYSLFHNIRTLDSYASYMIREVTDSLTGLAYDERIEEFIRNLKKYPEGLDDLGYLIVDEIQDLVGVRARMVKAMLQRINCGFMLLGDKCQSIFDYQIEGVDELSSEGFYEWLESDQGPNPKKYELTGNRRQIKKVASPGNQLRIGILHFDCDLLLKMYPMFISDLDKVGFGELTSFVKHRQKQEWAILCRTNARVEDISGRLHDHGITHGVALGSQRVVLPPWIARVFSDYTGRLIGFKAFQQKLKGLGIEKAKEKWGYLKTVEGRDDKNTLDVRRLREGLAAGYNIPDKLNLALKKRNITVSTIHRAKGKEYDGVLWLKEMETGAQQHTTDRDEFKIAYVALTRPRQRLAIVPSIVPFYIKALSSSRLIQTAMSRRNRPYCYAFQVGLEGDMHANYFVWGDEDEDEARPRQEYINEQVRIGDPVDIAQMDKFAHIIPYYFVYHNKEIIGILSDHIEDELREAMYVTNQSRALPNKLTGAYVRNIVTVVQQGYDERVAEPYATSGFWLGVEIGGLARTSWPSSGKD